jgi:hypothetical protein
MPATLGTSTSFNPQTSSDTNHIKGLMTAIAVPNSSIVYDSGTFLIYKITVGTGTYADIYVRFSTQYGGNVNSTGWVVTVGTNQTTGNLTGGGTATWLYPYTSNTVSYPALSPTSYRTIATTDNTVRGAIFMNGTTPAGCLLFVQATSTTRTAANQQMMHVVTGWANQAAATSFSTPAASYVFPANPGAFGPTANSGANNVTLGLPATFGLTTPSGDGTYPVVPNLPLVSNGWPWGSNSNLAVGSSSLLMLDRILVTAGSEEYRHLGQGLYVREV